MREVLRKDGGFTLIELMVVVLIIGILVAIAVPIFNAAKGSAQSKTCFANERTIEGAAQSYQASSGSLPAAGAVNAANVLVANSYIKVAPICPTTSAVYTLDSAGTVASCGTHGHY